MSVVTLDFETFYVKEEYSVRDLGNWRYTHDSRFDPYLISVYDGENSWVGEPKNFNWDALEDASLLLAHNAAFDSSVTNALVEQGKAPKFLLQKPWQCTANLGAFLTSERALANVVKVLEGRMLSKAARDEMNKKTWADVVNTPFGKKLADYALADSIEAHNIWAKYSHRWSDFEQRLSTLTMKQCARGVAINQDLLNQYIKVLQEVIFNLEKKMPWTKRGGKPTSPKAIAEECRMAGIPAPPVKDHDEEGFYAWQATFGPKYDWVYFAGKWRSLRKLLSSLQTIRERIRPDGTIDFSLLYFGAHTGRWSGGGSGLNFQNFRKIPLFIKDMCLIDPPTKVTAAELKAWVAANVDFILDIRKLLVPRPGKKMICSDLSQIEPRVLAWFVGAWEFLNLLKDGMSPYEAHARLSMGWTAGKLKNEDPIKYNLAKVRVLSLGYGAGWEKLITMAAEYDVFLEELESRQTVVDFRTTNKPIVDFWYSLDNDFRKTELEKGDFVMGLPSGRELRYRSVRRELKLKQNRTTKKMEKQYVYTAQVGDERVETYGGKLTENLVQATARDIFAGQVLELEDSGVPVLWTVHDEAVCEVDQDVQPRDIEHVMSKCPEWMPGLPLAAEAQEVPHYVK